jgi:hypothetical protein
MYGGIFERGCKPMAIQDRNLSVGTKLYARYKGTTYTAEVVLDPNATGDRPIAYRVDGKDQLFKSPSAAGSAVMGGNACNGWAFWSVGDGGEPKAAKSQKPEASSTVTPAPKPAAKRRSRKSQPADEPPTGEAPDGDETRDDAPPATEPDEGPVPCAECGETFPSVAAATEHYYATHGKPEGEPGEKQEKS